MKFKLDAMPGIFEAAGATGDAYVLIWTTTPWTLPANAAVCLMPDADYVMVQVDGSNIIFAKELVEEVAEIAGWEDYSPGVRPGRPAVVLKGKELCGLPILAPSARTLKARSSTATMSTLDSGTGCVHTAPGHGQDDYLVGLQFDIPILMPVDDNGVLTDDAGPFAGLSNRRGQPRHHRLAARAGDARGCAQRSTTAIRIAGAAMSPSSSAPPTSGSSPWRRTACAARPWTPSTRM